MRALNRAGQRVLWRRFLQWAVKRQGGAIYRDHGVKDVRAALAQAIGHIDAYDGSGPARKLKGKLKEVVRRTLEVWDGALPWTPEGTATPTDRKVMGAIMEPAPPPAPTGPELLH